MNKNTYYILITLLASFACNAGEPSESNEPSLFWNPIAYWQKAIKDPATEIGHAQIDHLSHEMTEHVLPAAQTNLRQAGDALLVHAHETGDALLVHAHEAGDALIISARAAVETSLQSAIKSAALALCWVGVAVFGTKLAYDNIKEHDGTIKSKHTVKTILGIGCVALAIYCIYSQFE